jgi:hypothetical protein
MRIWTEICLEPGVQRLNEKYTIVLYLSEKKIVLKAKTRSGVVKSLLNSGQQVFGACAPVNDLVVQTIKNLDGKKLSQNIIDRLERKNKKYSPFRFSRDYQLILKWLTFELEGKRIEKSTFRREIRAKRLL